MPPQREDRLGRQDVRPDQRRPFQRDRDRILYSAAFRRLAGVTQVVSPGEGEIFHNRLTHTLKVAQIARRLAEMLLARPGGEQWAAGWGGVDPDVVEAAALAHDLGHPPFGHTAEAELNALVGEAAGEGGYEGNAQSFRIVTRLSVRKVEGANGLDLTRAVLNATLKYPVLWSPGAGKWGAYPTEKTEFKFARSLSLADPTKPCIEAQLMDWADDIAYSVHDTEDFYQAGLIPLDRLAVNEAEQKTFLRGAHERRKQIGKPFTENPEDLRDIFKQLCKSLKTAEPYRGTRSQRGQLGEFVSHMISTLVQKTDLRPHPGNDGQGWKILPDHLSQVALLKELTWFYVINNSALAGHRHGQRVIIRTLFSILLHATERKEWTLFPPQFQEEADALIKHYPGEIPKADRIRFVVDAIAALTDQQAIRLYQRLTGYSQGSILAPITI